MTSKPASEELLSAFRGRDGREPAVAARSLAAELRGSLSSPELGVSLALALQALGETDAALLLLERAHYLEPGNAEWLYLYGLALESGGHVTQARLRYEAVARLVPEHEAARARLEHLPDPLARALERLTRPDAEALSPPADSVTAAAPAPVEAPAKAAPADAEYPQVREPAPLVTAPVRTAPAPRPHPLTQPPAGPAPPEAPPLWTPPRPAFGQLVREAALLWAQRPLLWFFAFALANAPAAALAGSGPDGRALAALLWNAGFAVGAAVSLLLMLEQWAGPGASPALRRPPWGRLASGLGFCIFYAALTLLPWSISGALQTELPQWALVLGSLLFTAPFHALLAPGLVTSVRAKGGTGALSGAFRLAGRRTWLHLGVMVTGAVVVGGVVGAFGWGVAVTLHPEGEVLMRMMENAGVSAGETVWAALVTVCGLDALAGAPQKPRSVS